MFVLAILAIQVRNQVLHECVRHPVVVPENMPWRFHHSYKVQHETIILEACLSHLLAMVIDVFGQALRKSLRLLARMTDKKLQNTNFQKPAKRAKYMPAPFVSDVAH